MSGRSNLTAYLVDHAGKLPRAAAISSAERMQPRWRDSRQHLAPVDRQALAEMRRVWSVARAYFPGQGMPVPRFGANSTSAGVAFAPDPHGGEHPIGINWQRSDSRELAHPRNDYERSDALRALLHEWAHVFQNASIYKDKRAFRPLAEGGAEAFSIAAAPLIAQALARRYQGPSGVAPEYRPHVLKVLRQRGMLWIMRAQFGH